MKNLKLQLLILISFIISSLTACDSDDVQQVQAAVIKYENPVVVSINGYSDHAMEPFISPDGQTLFFNSINDGENTRLFYATKVDVNTFTFEGEVLGANELAGPQLNAVPDIDALNNFYWTSVRDYPAKLDNLHFGSFNSGELSDVGRVQGDFYIGQPGWLVMDHGISYDGEILFYNNARFDQSACPGIPCETIIGMAKKEGQGLFNKMASSDSLLKNINNPNYIYYAPSITKDNLELYYTRFLKGPVSAATLAEICVATREDISMPFGKPEVLFSNTVGDGIVEAPSLSKDKKLMYYHKKVDGLHKILFRTRN